MTRDFGPKSAIAHGALRPKSKFGGLLDSFSDGIATLYLKENRDLHTLSDFELVAGRRGLAADLGRFAGASVLCELVMRLAPEQRDEPLYAALRTGLDALLTAKPPAAESTALQEIWRMVGELGFEPHLTHCLQCGRAVEAEQVLFDYAGGGVVCGGCAGGRANLSPAELGALRDLVAGKLSPRTVAGGQRRLLADFVRYHVAEGLRLRSLGFLEAI
jgi:DNA repair protein RecO (recombination protein O)